MAAVTITTAHKGIPVRIQPVDSNGNPLPLPVTFSMSVQGVLNMNQTDQYSAVFTPAGVGTVTVTASATDGINTKTISQVVNVIAASGQLANLVPTIGAPF